MNKFILATIVYITLFGGIASTSLIYSQNLFFCKAIDENGYPKNESMSFKLDTANSALILLVRLDDEIKSHEVRYFIYKVKGNNEEILDRTITQSVNVNSLWFWKQVIFSETGKYNVYVYNDYGGLLASASVRIN